MVNISFLSAVRNEAEHIEELIRSFIAQDHQDWELVFVDDGSTDATVEIIRRFTFSEPRVKLAATQPARGKVSAFSTAFNASSGDVIALVGGDDRIPEGGLTRRVRPFLIEENKTSTVALFKIRTFSSNSKMDGMVLPKGKSSSRSGGSLTMTRDLAERVFPIPEHLVSEDIWLAESLRALAKLTVESQGIVLDYRIHEGNTNPRHLPFDAMSKSAHRRQVGVKALLESDLPFTASHKARLQERWRTEQFRYRGEWFKILTKSRLPLVDRAAAAAHANPVLYRIRSQFYSLFSGRRGG